MPMAESPKEVIHRLCELVEEVKDVLDDWELPADCFCGDGGFWRVRTDHWPDKPPDGWKFEMSPIEFIERAVTDALAATRLLDGILE